MKRLTEDRFYPLRIATVFVIVTLIIFARSFNAFVHPILHCEDGTIMFAYYLSHTDPSSILRAQGWQMTEGYVSLLPNAVGYLAVRLSPALAPYSMSIYALLVSGFSMTLFALRRFRSILPDDTLRRLACVILALMPIGDFAVMSSTTYSQWHLLMILLLLTAAPVPLSPVVRVLQLCFLVLAVASHPLSIIILPLCVVLLFIRRGAADRVINISLIVAAGIYFSLGVRPEMATSKYPIRLETFWVGLRYVLHRVLFEGLLGNRLRVFWHTSGHDHVIELIAVVILCLLGLLVFLTRKRLARDHVPVIIGLGMLVYGLTLVEVVTRVMTPDSHLQPMAQRYFFIQQLAVVLVAIVALTHLIQSVKWPRPRVVLQILLVASVAGYIGALNICNLKLFQTRKEEGIRVVEFTRAVEARLRAGPGARGARLMTLKRGGTWDIRIDLENVTR